MSWYCVAVLIFSQCLPFHSVEGMCPASTDGYDPVETNVTFGQNWTLPCPIPPECNRGVWRKIADSTGYYEDIMEGNCGGSTNNANLCHRQRDGINVMDIEAFREEDAGCYVCQCDGMRLPVRTVAKFDLEGVCQMKVTVMDEVTNFINTSVGFPTPFYLKTVPEDAGFTIECQERATLQTNCTGDKLDVSTLRVARFDEPPCFARCVFPPRIYSYTECAVNLMVDAVQITTRITTEPTPITSSSSDGGGGRRSTTDRGSEEIDGQEPDTDLPGRKPEVFPDYRPEDTSDHVAILLPLIMLVLFLISVMVGLCCYLYAPVFNSSSSKSFRDQATYMAHWNAPDGYNRCSGIEGELEIGRDIELWELSYAEESKIRALGALPTLPIDVGGLQNPGGNGTKRDTDGTKNEDVMNTCGNNNLIPPTTYFEDDYCSMHSYETGKDDGTGMKRSQSSKTARDASTSRNIALQRSLSETAACVIYHHKVDGGAKPPTVILNKHGSGGMQTANKLQRKSYPGYTGHQGEVKARDSEMRSPESSGTEYNFVRRSCPGSMGPGCTSCRSFMASGMVLKQEQNRDPHQNIEATQTQTDYNAVHRSPLSGKADKYNTYYHAYDDMKEKHPSQQEDNLNRSPYLSQRHDSFQMKTPQHIPDPQPHRIPERKESLVKQKPEDGYLSPRCLDSPREDGWPRTYDLHQEGESSCTESEYNFVGRPKPAKEIMSFDEGLNESEYASVIRQDDDVASEEAIDTESQIINNFEGQYDGVNLKECGPCDDTDSVVYATITQN